MRFSRLRNGLYSRISAFFRICEYSLFSYEKLISQKMLLNRSFCVIFWVPRRDTIKSSDFIG